MKRHNELGLAMGAVLILASASCRAGLGVDQQKPVSRESDREMPTAQAGMQTAPTSTLPMEQPLIRATDLIGKPFEDLQGKVRGNVEDVVLTEDRQGVAYVAVSLTDFADKYYEVPLSEIRMVPDRHVVVADLTQDKLAGLTHFERNAWPAGHDQRKLTTILGMELRDSAGKSVCHIRDALLDTEKGTIDEATVGVGGLMGIREKYASLDWKRIAFLDREQFASTDIPEEQLKSRAYSETEYWQRLGFAGERMTAPKTETELAPQDSTPVEPMPQSTPPAEKPEHQSY